MIQNKLERLDAIFNANLDGVQAAEKVEWYLHPCTKALLSYLELTLETQKATWANGGFTGSSQDETIQANSAAIGKCDALIDVDEAIRFIGGKSSD